MGCGCEGRKSRLNEWRPGLGDKVAIVAEPIKRLLPLLIGISAFVIMNRKTA